MITPTQLNTNDLAKLDSFYTVSQLNRMVRQTLEDGFPLIAVVGEISNFLAHSSGHWYFSLKDAQAQVRCVFFRGNNRKLNIRPANGMQIKVRAHISLYEGRGDFQLMVADLEAAGEGALQQAFLALKQKLATLGWFNIEHKQALPLLPKRIGVVTSPTGAAIRDIISVLKRRFPCAPVIVYPTLVQGESASLAIAQAITIANERREVDVLIIARGGGSLEDLWSFNTEIVAEAIYLSKLPTISAIGHEIDFTIADFVADQRAPTPSGAAELATPDQQELLQTIAQNHRHLTQQISNKLSLLRQHLSWAEKHLHQQHPHKKLSSQMQQLDLYSLTVLRFHKQLHAKYQNLLSNLYTKIFSLKPYQAITQHRHELYNMQKKLQQLILDLVHQQQVKLAAHIAKINSFNPLNTLNRGYALVTPLNQPTIIKHVTETNIGDTITVKLQDGKLECQIIAIHPNSA